MASCAASPSSSSSAPGGLLSVGRNVVGFEGEVEVHLIEQGLDPLLIVLVHHQIIVLVEPERDVRLGERLGQGGVLRSGQSVRSYTTCSRLGVEGGLVRDLHLVDQVVDRCLVGGPDHEAGGLPDVHDPLAGQELVEQYPRLQRCPTRRTRRRSGRRRARRRFHHRRARPREGRWPWLLQCRSLPSRRCRTRPERHRSRRIRLPTRTYSTAPRDTPSRSCGAPYRGAPVAFSVHAGRYGPGAWMTTGGSGGLPGRGVWGAEACRSPPPSNDPAPLVVRPKDSRPKAVHRLAEEAPLPRRKFRGSVPRRSGRTRPPARP